MCGIVGAFAFSDKGQPYLNKITRANDCMLHRGPDGGAVFQDGKVALGHRRLSIIDTSDAANQPMYSADGRFCIVFNGEIFNFLELKKQYFSSHSFATGSDTEVFLQLYIEKGWRCFEELRGFFAAAIYDSHLQELVIVRDRFGKKPVHYFKNEDVFLFASELRSIFAFGIPKQLNRSILPYYFQLNYLPQPLGFIEQVGKLKAGHYIKLSKGNFEEKAYYQPSVYKERYGSLSYEAAQGKLVQLMDDATRLRLIADVPLGAFLSGGIDSSVVVALAARHQQKLKTFSIGYKDNPFFDETAYAELVAKKFATEHTVFRLGNDDFLEHIEDVLNSIDEPFADSSTIPSFILSKMTRKHVTVALSGDGGDEVFAGYNKHKAEWNAMQPSFKRSLVSRFQPLWKILPKSRNNKLTNTVRQLHRFAEGVSLTAESRYWRWASMLPGEESVALFSKGFKNSWNANHNIQDLFPMQISGTDLNEVLLADMQLVLAGDMLVKVDMMSMANSLEIRSPFLDSEVVDFAFGLPATYKINTSIKKRIVQDAFRSILPEALYNRPKQGFDIPLLNWFRNELWSKINDDLLADQFIQEQDIFDIHAIRTIKKKLHSSNPEDSHETIWALLVFQHWWKRHIA